MSYGASVTCGILFASVAAAGTLTWSEDLDLPSSWAAMRIPKWTHGAVLVVQFHDTTAPLLWIVEPKKTYNRSFSIPGATAIYVDIGTARLMGPSWLSQVRRWRKMARAATS